MPTSATGPWLCLPDKGVERATGVLGGMLVAASPAPGMIKMSRVCVLFGDAAWGQLRH